MELKYLIVGTPRSGTVYSARLLTSLGIPCGHESVFDWRGLDLAKKRLNGEEPLELSYASKTRWSEGTWHQLEDWLPDISLAQAESSYLAVPFLKEEVLKDTTIIHVTRNPVKMVHSICNYIGYFYERTPTNCYEDFIYAHVPDLYGNMPQYDRACLFWTKWNLMIEESNVAFRHRVEDDPQSLLNFLGISGEPFSDKTINSYKKKTDRRFMIDNIQSKAIRDEFVSLGKKYRYSMTSEYWMI